MSATDSSEIATCRASAEYFICQYVIIDDAQSNDDLTGTMPFDLWPAQKDLLSDIVKERLLFILKARQLGASWLVCAYALWLCLYKPGRVVLTFSIGQDEANEMLRRMSVMYHRLPQSVKAGLPSLIKENTEELLWSNGSHIQSLPARKTAGSGYTASLVILDEFAKNPNAAQLYTAVKPTIDGGGQLIILSTANGTANLFYDMCQKAIQGIGRFVFRFLPWHVRPGRDQTWYNATAADAIDETLMKQEYPATPDEAFEATDVDTFLPSIALWNACEEDIAPLDPHTPCILALDAGESNDTFATVIVSKHPHDDTRLAVRYVRPYVPSPGIALDFDSIEADIRWLVSSYAVQQIAYDPFLLGQTIRRLTSGADPIRTTCEPFPQGAQRLEADKALYDLITQRRIAHDGNAELRAHLANANRKIDQEGRRLRIVKRTYAQKIDLAVALSMGAYQAAAMLGGPAPAPAVGGQRMAYAKMGRR